MSPWGNQIICLLMFKMTPMEYWFKTIAFSLPLSVTLFFPNSLQVPQTADSDPDPPPPDAFWVITVSGRASNISIAPASIWDTALLNPRKMPVSEFLSQVPIPIHTTSNSLLLFIYPVGHYLHAQCLPFFFFFKYIFIWRIMDNGFTISCWFLPYNMSQPERIHTSGLPWWLRWLRICRQCRRPRFDPWVWKIPRRREGLPTPLFLPEEIHGQRSPWSCNELDTTERLTVYKCLLRLEPSSHFPPHSTPLGCLRALGLSSLSHIANANCYLFYIW